MNKIPTKKLIILYGRSSGVRAEMYYNELIRRALTKVKK